MSSFRSNFTPEEQERIIADAMRNLGLRRPDAERLANADRAARRNPILDAQWVRTFHAVTKAICDGSAQPLGLFASVFWIKLYGVLNDLRSRFRKSAEMRAYLRDSGKQHPFVDASANVFDACESIHATLTDEELIFATFARHVHAHVYQDSFEYSVERGNPVQNQPSALRVKQMIPTVRRHVEVDEAHRIVDEVVSRGGGDAAVLESFARKLLPYVTDLFDRMSLLEIERQQDRRLSTARRPEGAG